MGMREMLERGICPRCGQRMTYLEHRKVGGNTYLYAVHVRKEMKKRHVKRDCKKNSRRIKLPRRN
jgi:hypothetical protein